jgi:hypothetical protein
MSNGEPNSRSAGESPQQKACPACGVQFDCSASGKKCWCEEVKLGSKASADLRAQFSDCLCPRCLARAAEREGSPEDAQNQNPAEAPTR